MKDIKEVKNAEVDKKKVAKEWISYIGILILILVVVPNVINLTKISGLSMSPTFQDGNVVFEEKISKYFNTPSVGDVVTIIRPEDGYKIIKRVIANAGDEVAIKDGVIYVNKIGLPEIMTEGKSEDMSSLTVPKDHIFVIGDNRSPGASKDSRDPKVGPISLNNINGYVIFSIVPFRSIPKPISQN